MAAGPSDGRRKYIQGHERSDEHLVLRGTAADHLRARPRAADARDRRGEASARSESLVELCEDLLSGRGEASGVALRARNPRPLRRAHHRAAHRLLRGAGAALRHRSGAHGAGDRRLAREAVATRPPPKCMPPPSRAGRNCSAGSIWRRAAPRRWCACASN